MKIFAFVLTLAAVTAPTASAAPAELKLPASFSVEATGPGLTTVEYTAWAEKTLPPDKPVEIVPVTCEPGGSSVKGEKLTARVELALRPEPHLVTCRTGGEEDPVSGSFSITVRDTRPPTISNTPSPTRLEATSPAGAALTYALPTAVDLVDGPTPVTCTPPSGSVFALGTHTVSCVTSDTRRNVASSAFSVVVSDTTPPTLLVPAPLDLGTAPSPAGVPASDARIQTFLASARATDIVAHAPVIQVDSPSIFPVGTTTVRFTAADGFGNVVAKTSTVTVGAPVEPPVQVDTTPPEPVMDLFVGARSGVVVLTWQPPRDADFAQVSVTRARGSRPALEVYRGAEAGFRDRAVRAGARYTYVVTAYDTAGNRSAGVARTVTVPPASPLLAPLNGARVSTPPVLRWRPSERATYYNVQLWRDGRKILSRWPTRTQLALRATWVYSGRTYRLSPGRYRWFVWPGYGRLAAARYGRLLGGATFVVVRQT